MPRHQVRRGAKDKFRKVNTLSVAVGVSALVHTVAIGALLTLKPVPGSPAPVEIFEVSLVPDQVGGRPHPNNLSSAILGDRSADVSAVAFLSLTHPDVAATTSSPDWFRNVNAGRSFDVPVLPTFRSPTHAPAFDMLATMLDCLAVGGSTRGASGRSRPAHPPCASDDDPSLRARVMTLLPMYPSQPSETSAGIDYRTFMPSQSVFHESVFPDEVPPANRALEKWIVGLFH